MLPWQAAYRAGCIAREVQERFAPEKKLSPETLRAVARLPHALPVHFRHLWAKALKVPEVVALLDGFDPPQGPIDEVAQCSFWGGWYHQEVARNLPESFGAKLAALRDAKGMTREDLADAAGITRQSLHNYETGARRPTWDAVQAIAAALGVPTDTFRDA